MLLVLVKKEILNNLLSFRFAVTFLLLFLLLGGSVLMMALNYEKQVRDYTNAVTAYRERVEQMRDSEEFEIFGVTNRRKPNALSIFAMGLEPDLSRAVTISQWQGTEVGGNPYANPLFVLFSAPDVTHVLNIVVSLLAILFVFDAVSGEKEEETLKLMLSNPVPRDLILISKCVGGFVCLSAPFLISLGVGLLVAYTTTSIVFTPDEWLRIAVFTVVSLVYISAFLMLGLFISSCAQRSGTSLMMSLLAWVILVLAIPNLVPVVVRQIVPLPSSAAIAGERMVMEGEEWRRAQQEMRRVSTREERRKIYHETIETVRKRWNTMREKYENRLVQQASLSMIASRISPSACFTYAATALTQTGVDAYTKFVRYIYGDFQTQFENSVPELRKPGQSQRVTGPGVDVEKLPQFSPMNETVERSLKRSLLDVGLLCGYTVLFFLGGFVRFLRYDVK